MTLRPMKICGHLLKTPLKKRWFRAGLACLIFTASARAGYGRITNMMRWLVIAFLVGLARLQAAPAPELAPGSTPAPATNLSLQAAPAPELAPELWTSAQQSADIHRFSTLFTVQCVHSYLSSEADIAEAIRWCKASGVTKVYLEEYRDGHQAERQTLMRARDR